MTQNERLDFLLHYLIKERKEYENIRVPDSHSEKQRYLRSLMNVRPPLPVSAEFLSVQDAYLSERLVERGVTRFQDLTPVQPGLYLWRGDITTLAADTIVNAANSGMLGCFVPCHGCIDNAIHTYAGVQLRLECSGLMKRQGHKEEPGRAKITKPTTCPAGMCYTRSARSSAMLLRFPTEGCWQTATVPVLIWRRNTGFTA